MQQYEISYEAPIATLAGGLSEAELEAAEGVAGARFPADLRSLLQAFLPLGEAFPNWRDPGDEQLNWQLGKVSRALKFDLEYNDNFWLAQWGPRPEGAAERMEIATNRIAAGPRLIPVCGHRFLPEGGPGNPVLSMWQFVDTIHYGNDLADYFHKEFGVPRPPWAATSPRRIELWTDVVEWGDEETS
jgi:hypothetical protein